MGPRERADSGSLSPRSHVGWGKRRRDVGQQQHVGGGIFPHLMETSPYSHTQVKKPYNILWSWPQKGTCPLSSLCILPHFPSPARIVPAHTCVRESLSRRGPTRESRAGATSSSMLSSPPPPLLFKTLSLGGTFHKLRLAPIARSVRRRRSSQGSRTHQLFPPWLLFGGEARARG